jgi:hypothetical protein
MSLNFSSNRGEISALDETIKSQNVAILILRRIKNDVHVYYLTSARLWLHVKIEQTE